MSFVPLVRIDRVREGLRKVKRVRGRRLLLIHSGGTSYLIDDHCPHMDSPLARGHLDGHLLWCPKHGFCFDLETGLRVSPPVTGSARQCLVRHRLVEQDGMLGIDPDAPPTGLDHS